MFGTSVPSPKGIVREGECSCAAMSRRHEAERPEHPALTGQPVDRRLREFGGVQEMAGLAHVAVWHAMMHGSKEIPGRRRLDGRVSDLHEPEGWTPQDAEVAL